MSSGVNFCCMVQGGVPSVPRIVSAVCPHQPAMPALRAVSLPRGWRAGSLVCAWACLSSHPVLVAELYGDTCYLVRQVLPLLLLCILGLSDNFKKAFALSDNVYDQMVKFHE